MNAPSWLWYFCVLPPVQFCFPTSLAINGQCTAASRVPFLMYETPQYASLCLWLLFDIVIPPDTGICLIVLSKMTGCDQIFTEVKLVIRQLYSQPNSPRP
jgi:hypothetical protein